MCTWLLRSRSRLLKSDGHTIYQAKFKKSLRGAKVKHHVECGSVDMSGLKMLKRLGCGLQGQTQGWLRAVAGEG